MWVFVVPGEEPERSEIYGPYRTEARAAHFANQWRADHPDDTDDTFVRELEPYRGERYGSTR